MTSPRSGRGNNRHQLLLALADLIERSVYYGIEQALSDLRVAIRQLDRQTTSPATVTPADT